jgi:hypothetical protein
MKTKLIFGSAVLSLAMTQPLSAQFQNSAPGGSVAQYLNQDATMRRAYLTGEHLVFNSQHGAIDWGSGTTGDLFFRTLSTQGVIGGYTDRMILKNNGDLGLGTISPGAKLHVVGPNITSNPGAGGAHSGKFQITSTAYGDCNGVLGITNVSGLSFGQPGHNSGIRGEASGNNTAQVTIVGVTGVSTGGLYNVGGYFQAVTTPNQSWAAAVYGQLSNAGSYGNSWAGYFDGDVNINGLAYCSSGLWSGSDQKLKKDIKLLTNGMEKLRLLKPSTYTFRTEEFKDMNLPEENQLGLIAQELEKIFPELVTSVPGHIKTDDKGKEIGTIPEHKAVNYIGLIPVLISAAQEQDKTILSQQQQIDELKQLLKESLNAQATGINSANTPETGFQMSQNEPNPFTHETVVKYTLPQTTGSAFMAVYDLTGKQITTLPITQKGSSSITLTSEKLTAGIYIYSIVADGKVVDSKRMIVADK